MCVRMFDLLMKQYTKIEDVTKQLKTENLMKWFSRINNLSLGENVGTIFFISAVLNPESVKIHKIFDQVDRNRPF